jgi:NAD(P)-dependent dehydrogenase (short-subunit alcohol dehydrogenase family)
MSPSELFDLTGQTAVVIGGTGELCGAMAEGLASAGAHVVLVGRNPDKAAARLDSIRAAGGEASFEAADVSTKAALTELCERLVGKHGSIDVLINGAGVNSPTPFLDIPEEEIDRILDVNLKAVMFACQVFGARMLAQEEGGSIINLGSISGLNPLSRVFTYSVSKAAVHNLTRNLAREWGTRGVRVNTLVPGFFPAEQNRKVLTPDRVDTILGKTAMKRFGDSHELTGATLLLASRKAGSFITGIEMIVDGGFNAISI